MLNHGDINEGETSQRMLRVAVGLNRLWLAGAEINAVDLARAIRSKGHEVLLFAQAEKDQPMVDIAANYGLRVRLLAPKRRRDIIYGLDELVNEERIDVVHAYSQRLALAAYLGPGHRPGTPVVSTYYDMDPPRGGMPPYAHLIVGTEALAVSLRAWYGSPTSVIEPPVDISRDHPGAVDSSQFLEQYQLDPRNVRIVIVSRMEREMKFDGIVRVMLAVDAIGRNGSVDVVIVGSGDGLLEAQGIAAAVNERLDRRAIVLTGRIADPRQAYECADIVVGMGGSALRGMAFGKPVVVVGETGFSLPFEPETAEFFYKNGFYGEGPLMELPAVLARLVHSPDLRESLGRFGVSTIRNRYSLALASSRLEDIYQKALTYRLSRRAWASGAAYSVTYATSERVRKLEKARRLYVDEKVRIATRAYAPLPRPDRTGRSHRIDPHHNADPVVGM